MNQLYFFVYYMDLPLLYLLAVLLLGGWTAASAFCGRRYPRFWRWLCTGLVPVCLYLVYAGTLRGRLPGEHQHFFIPFQVLFTTDDFAQVFRETTLNTLLFAPLGAVLPFALPLKKPAQRIWAVAGIALAVSLTVEILQASLRVGHFQTDDLFLNVLGCLIGTSAFLVYRWANKEKTT
ncbi:MAG: VanZ family protein [Clostridia bacterium]|nr:VanZ family protein [Clostridia bacterium]